MTSPDIGFEPPPDDDSPAGAEDEAYRSELTIHWDDGRVEHFDGRDSADG